MPLVSCLRSKIRASLGPETSLAIMDLETKMKLDGEIHAK